MSKTYGTGIYGSSMNIPEPCLRSSGKPINIAAMNNIAHYRKLRGLSQLQLGEMVGVKQPHISRIEAGDEGPPLKLFREIAAALGVHLSDLFSEEMTKAEMDLIQGFRALPRHLRPGWVEMAKAAAAPAQPEDQ